MTQQNNPLSWPTRYWSAMPDGRLRCDLCPRYCKLREGQRGLCYVRQRQQDQIVLTTWGRSSGFCIDPVEKKPLNHFFPGTPVLSFGTAGCNLACKFCQNWDISKSREMDTLNREATPNAIAKAAHRYGCRSVAYTYNDPVIFLEYARDVGRACRELDIKNIAVTAGYITDVARPAFFEYMDAANVDLKAFSEDFYRKLCGAELENIKETLVYLVRETSVWVEITTLLIPDENDSDQELHAMTEWIAESLGVDVPLHFSAFHPDWKMLDKSRTPIDTLLRARHIAHSKGLRYVYCGNVHHPESDTTWCHECSYKLIERDWYELGRWGLDETGRCGNCGTVCAGHLEAAPGTWGQKRLPISL